MFSPLRQILIQIEFAMRFADIVCRTCCRRHLFWHLQWSFAR